MNALTPLPRPLDAVETWIFDLDNTLYPHSCGIYRQVELRMTGFIMAELALDFVKAQALRRRFFEQHGTTLRGLMKDYGLTPHRFLEYVHDLDLSPVPRDPDLVAAIAGLPGRKVIFTNGTARHAERLLAHLELTTHFSGIHDIVACDYTPKPDPRGYHALLARHRIAPENAAMVEDMAKNLAPAAALGMTTVWVTGGPHVGAKDAGAAHVHHVVDHLASFLAAIPGAGAARAMPAAE